MALTRQQIQKAYIAFFNRPADVTGLLGWLQHEGDDADLLVTFSKSTEYTDLFTGKTPEEIVTTIYKNLFARTPDLGGFQNWVNNLKAGTINIGNIAYEMLNSAGDGDKDTIAAKLEAAEQFTKHLALVQRSSEGYETGGAAAGVIVREWFAQIGESGSGKQSVLDAIGDVGDKLAGLVDAGTEGTDEEPGIISDNTLSESARHLLALETFRSSARWNFPETEGKLESEISTAGIGKGVTLTYSFLTELPDYAENDSYYATIKGQQLTIDTDTFSVFSDAQKKAAREALAHISEVVNITFQEAKAGEIGQITFANSYHPDLRSEISGWAVYPSYIWHIRGGKSINLESEESSGDIWINSAGAWTSWTPGTFDFQTLLHEIGHALGLKHPHDPNRAGVTLSGEEDDNLYTIMSYKMREKYDVSADNSNYPQTPFWPDHTLYPDTLMPLDIEALQYLYGANLETRAGNTTYQWSENDNILETIWDAGGIDTINVSNKEQSIINLNAGEYSAINYLSGAHWITGVNNLTIAKNVLIENAKTGMGNDTLIGNTADNRLEGGLGDDLYAGYHIGANTNYNDNGEVVDISISGHDTIRDTGGDDRIEITNARNDIGLANVKISRSGHDLVLTLSADNKITIEYFYAVGGAIESLVGGGIDDYWSVDLVGVAKSLANGAFTTLGEHIV